MANNKIELELLLKAQQAIQEAKGFQTSVEKITDATNELKSATALLASAQQKEAQAVQSGDKQAIASARERIEILQKGQQEAVKALEQETKAYERLIEVEKKAVEQQAKADASKVASPLGGIGDISKIAEAFANPAAAVGLLIEKFQQLDKQGQEAIKNIGEKFSRFIIDLSEGNISVETFIEGLKGSISTLGEQFGLTGIAAAQFNNVLLSGFQALSNITLEVAEEQKAFRGLTQTLGLTTETLKTYEQALQQAGLPTSNLRLILLGVSQSLEKLTQEEPRASAAFKKLKLSAEDFVGLNADQKFKLVLDRIRELNAVNKEAAADVAGVVAGSKRYVEQLDLIARNAETNRQSIKDYGAALSDLGDKNVLELGRKLTDLDNFFTGIKNTIAEKFAPELSRLAEQIKLVLTSLKADPAIIAFFEALFGAVVTVTRALGFLLLSAEGAILALLRFKDLIPGVKQLVDIFNLLRGSTEGNTKALEEFTQKQNEAKEAEEKHEKTLKQLQRTFQDLSDTTRNLNENAKAGAEERIAIFEREAEAGKLTAVEAKELILKERQELSRKLIENAVFQLTKTQQLAQQDIKFLEQVESARANLAKVESETAKANATAEKDLRKAVSDEIIAQIEREKNERITKNKETINEINKLENEGKKSHLDAANERNAITRKEIEEEIRINKQLSEDSRLTAKARGDARKEVSKLTVDLANQDLKAEKEANTASIKDTKDTEAAKKKAKEDQSRELESSIKTRNALTKAANEEEKQGIQELVDKFTSGQLSKEEALRKAFLLELDLTEKSLANQISNLADLTTQKSLGKDVDDKIIAANEEITKLQREQLALQKALKGEIDGTSEAVKKAADSFKDVDKNASKSKDSIKDNEKSVDDLNSAIQKTAGKILSIKENFDASKASVEELKQQIIDLRADADSIRFSATLAFPGKDAVVKSFEDSAEAIEKILGERISKEQFERFKEQQEAELAERRKAAEQALEIAKNLEKEQQKLLEDTKEVRKDINDQIKQNESDKKEALEGLATEQGEKLKEFDEKQTQEELNRQEAKNQQKIQKEISFQGQLLNIKTNFEKEKTKAEEESLSKKASLEAEINELIAKQSKADPEDKVKIEEEIKKKRKELSDLDTGDKTRIARETKKGEEIENARKQADEKRKGAKTSEELEQIEKELSIQIEGIDKKFNIEEKAEEELKKFRGRVSEETLAAIKANFEKQKQQAEQFTKEKLEIERKRFTAEQAARDSALAKEKADNEQRRKDFIDGQKKEFDDRAKSFDDKDKQLKEALKKEREEYKKHVAELQTKTAEALASIAASFTDGGIAAEKFFKDFATSAGLTGKAIDDILKKLKQFKDEVASDAQQTNNAAGGNASSTSPSNPSSSSPNGQNNSTGNPFSGPPSNNSGANGTIGNNITAIAQQPNGDKGTNNPNPSPNTPNNDSSNGNSLSANNNANSNTTIGVTPSSQNAVNQNKSSENQGNGSYPTIPDEIKTGNEYKALVLQILEVLLQKAGVKNVNDPGSGDIFLKGKKGNQLEAEARQLGAKALRVYGLTALRANPALKDKAEEVYAKQINGVFAGGTENSVISILVTIDFKDGKGFTNLKSNRKRHADFADQVIVIVEKLRNKVDKDKGNDGFGDKDKPDIPNSGNSGNDATPGDKGGDGFGDQDKPTIPKAPDVPRGRDLTDAEKAFAANRDKDTQNGDGEGASKKGFVRVEADAAVKGNPNTDNTGSNSNSNSNSNSAANPNSSTQTQPTSPGTSSQTSAQSNRKQAQAPDSSSSSSPNNNPADNTQSPTQISQTNNSDVTINLYSQGFLGDNKTVNQLKDLFSDLMSQQTQVNQDRLRNLNGANLARRG